MPALLIMPCLIQHELSFINKNESQDGAKRVAVPTRLTPQKALKKGIGDVYMLGWMRQGHWDMQLRLQCMTKSPYTLLSYFHLCWHEWGRSLGYTAVITVHAEVCLYFSQLLTLTGRLRTFSNNCDKSKCRLHAVLLHFVAIGANKFAYICRRRCAVHTV